MYTPINPSESYDRNTFANSWKSLNSLEKFVSDLRKDPNKAESVIGLGEILYGDGSFFTSLPNPGFASRFQGERAAVSGKREMRKYVKNNLDDFLDKVDDKGAFGVMISPGVKLYETGNKEYDRVIEVINELKKVNSVADNPERRAQYLHEKVSNSPDWLKETFALFAGSPDYESKLFQVFARHVAVKFQKLSRDKKDEKGFFAGLLRESLSRAKEEDKERYYLPIANYVGKSLAGEEDEREDEEEGREEEELLMTA